MEGLSTASINPLLCARSGVRANLQTLCSLVPCQFWTLHHMLLQLLCDLVIHTETLEKVVTVAKDIFQLWGTSCYKLRICWSIDITCFSVGINHCSLGCSFYCGDHKPLTNVCPLLSVQCALSDFQQVSPQEKHKANHISMLTLRYQIVHNCQLVKLSHILVDFQFSVGLIFFIHLHFFVSHAQIIYDINAFARNSAPGILSVTAEASILSK